MLLDGPVNKDDTGREWSTHGTAVKVTSTNKCHYYDMQKTNAAPLLGHNKNSLHKETQPALMPEHDKNCVCPAAWIQRENTHTHMHAHAHTYSYHAWGKP